MSELELTPESLTQDDDLFDFGIRTLPYTHATTSEQKEVRKLSEKLQKKGASIQAVIAHCQQNLGLFPDPPALDLYGFGLPPPSVGLRTRWKHEHTSRKDQERREFRRLHGEVNSFADQARFERFLRLRTNISPLGRTSAGSRTGSQTSTPAASTSRRQLPPVSSPSVALEELREEQPPQVKPTSLPSISFGGDPPFPPFPETDEPAFLRDEPASGDDPHDSAGYESAVGEQEEVPPAQEHGKPSSPSSPSHSSHGTPTNPPPMAQPQQTQVVGGGKVKPPNDFDGTSSDVRRWVNGVIRYKRMKPRDFADKDEWILWATTLIDGSQAAQKWAEDVALAHMKATDTDPTVQQQGVASEFYSTDWNAFIAKFKDRFGDPHEADTARREMVSLKQERTESIKDFHDRFREIANKTTMSDEDKFYAFKCKVHPGIAWKVASVIPQPTTLNAWSKAAADIEHQLNISPASSASRQQMGASQVKGSSLSGARSRVQFNSNPGGPRITYQRQQPPPYQPSYQSQFQPPSFAPQHHAPSISRGPPTISRSFQPPPQPGSTSQSVGRLANLTCFYCKQKGHLMRNCPNKKMINKMTHQEIFSMMENLLTQQEELVADDPQPDQPIEPPPEKDDEPADDVVAEDDLPPGMNFYHQDE